MSRIAPAKRHLAVAGRNQTMVGDGHAVGETISHHKILERIGSGDMGEVWKAKDLNRAASAGSRGARDQSESAQRFAHDVSLQRRSDTAGRL